MEADNRPGRNPLQWSADERLDRFGEWRDFVYLSDQRPSWIDVVKWDVAQRIEVLEREKLGLAVWDERQRHRSSEITGELKQLKTFEADILGVKDAFKRLRITAEREDAKSDNQTN